MAINKTYPGPQVVSKRCIVRDALASSGAGPQFGLMQPANSIIEKINYFWRKNCNITHMYDKHK